MDKLLCDNVSSFFSAKIINVNEFKTLPIFEVADVIIDFSHEWFIPSSLLSEWRKTLTGKLLDNRKANYQQEVRKINPTSHAYPDKQLTYLGNVANEKARMFYAQHHSEVQQPAFELVSQKNEPVMFSKHCIKYALNACPRETKHKVRFQEPLYLENSRLRLKLEFDCVKCEMSVRLPTATLPAE